MECVECGHKPVNVRRENHRYTRCGLDYVTLVNIEVRHCPACGQNEYAIPAIEQLHQLIANVIATKEARLMPAELRFLRKYLGYSSAEFAKAVGVAASTISRWERMDDPQQMEVGFERLIRLMVMHEKPLASYSRTKVADIATKDAAPAKLRVTSNRNGWQTDEARPS